MSDPRDDPGRGKADDELTRLGDEEPVVGSTARGLNVMVIVAVFAVFAVALFLFLNARRGGRVQSAITPPAHETAAMGAPPPLDIKARMPTPPPQPAPPPAPVAKPLPPPPPSTDAMQRLHAPSIVVDLGTARAGAIPVSTNSTSGPTGGPAAKTASSGPNDGLPPVPANEGGAPRGGAQSASPLLAGAEGGGNGLGANEQFATRVSVSTPAKAVATQMTDLGTTIPQGAIIPAVLETAINSDLPGYTRAVVSHDVLGFDGKNVLIPRGSRLIGQYRNALSLGQSRVFIIWTRVIRPDGVTVQIGSPGADALGREGLTGDVDSHFFSRFGGAILLSVLNGGIAAIAGTPSTQISIGSPAAAAGVAASAAVPTATEILPTIKVKQGGAINIFVARDLDFSAVNPVK